MSRSKRPASPGSVDDLCIVGCAIQHQERKDKGSEFYSFTYQVKFNSNTHTGLIDINDQVKFSKLVGEILENSRLADVFDQYPRDLYLAIRDTNLLLEIIQHSSFPTDSVSVIRSSPVSMISPVKVRFSDRNKNIRQTKVWITDIRLLGADRNDLIECGEWVGITTSGIPDQGQWKQLHDDNRNEFETKAEFAAAITCEFAYGVANFTGKTTKSYSIPLTIASLSEQVLIDRMEEKDGDLNAVLGCEVIKTKSGPFKTTKVLQERLFLEERLAVECCHGGRNECFFYGITDDDDWRDDDICAAYPTVLSTLGLPDWDGLFRSKEIAHFEGDVFGVAKVYFIFPEEVRFPILPVRVGDKLIFPRSGTSYVTAPEITLALRLGAEIEILEGIVIPVDVNERPFESAVKELLSLRTNASDMLDERLAKRMANSVTGKFAQGLPPKRLAAIQDRNLKPSRLTQAYLSSHICGSVRALVGEITNGLPDEVQVLATVTDGFISNAREDQLSEALKGDCCTGLANARERLTGDRKILETKRKARKLLCIRNRVFATLTPDGARLILSRSGITTPKSELTVAEKNDWLVKGFLVRIPKDTFEQRSFDETQKQVKVKLDYDFDRKPVKPSIRQHSGKRHLTFSTEPWEDVGDYEAAAKALTIFQKDRCLKDLDDFRDLNDLIQSKQSAERNSFVSVCSTTDAPLKTARKQFLRALKEGRCGLIGVSDSSTHRQIADKINNAISKSSFAGKIKVSENDLKNAGRSSSGSVIDKLVPKTDRTVEFFDLMKSVFPGFHDEDLISTK